MAAVKTIVIENPYASRRRTRRDGVIVHPRYTSKPIETQFDGYLFRSRLEARWAVFFKRLGVKYEYEPVGFDIDIVKRWDNDNLKYLPDFFLPDARMWAEVKPDEFTEWEMEKVTALVMSRRQACVLLAGSPQARYYPVIFPHASSKIFLPRLSIWYTGETPLETRERHESALACCRNSKFD